MHNLYTSYCICIYLLIFFCVSWLLLFPFLNEMGVGCNPHTPSPWSADIFTLFLYTEMTMSTECVERHAYFLTVNVVSTMNHRLSGRSSIVLGEMVLVNRLNTRIWLSWSIDSHYYSLPPDIENQSVMTLWYGTTYMYNFVINKI